MKLNTELLPVAVISRAASELSLGVWLRIRQSRDSDEVRMSLETWESPSPMFLFLSQWQKAYVASKMICFYACLSLSPGFEVWVLAKPPSRTSWRKESAEKRPMFSFKHVRCRSTVRHGGPRQPSEICREEMFFVGKPVLKRHIAEVKYTCYMLCVQMHIYIYTHMALMFVAMFDVLDRLLMCLWPLYILLWLMWWYIYICLCILYMSSTMHT